MDHKYCAQSDAILIRPLKKSDIEFLRIWRNTPEISTYLRSIPYITYEKQVEWYEKYLEDKYSMFFAIFDKDNNKDDPIGSIALYNLSKEKCDVGKIVIGDLSSHGKGIGYKSLLLAITVAIKELGITIIGLDVHEDNIPARSIYNKAGFTVVGKHQFDKGGYELKMEIISIKFFDVNPMANSINVFLEDEMSRKFENWGGIAIYLIINGVFTSRIRRCS